MSAHKAGQVEKADSTPFGRRLLSWNLKANPTLEEGCTPTHVITKSTLLF
jgi:hypothetical protein